MTETVVSVRELQTTFHTRAGPVRAVDGISYDIAKGRTLGIVGESGCGKSVTSYSVMRLIEPPGEITGGSVLLDGEDLLSLPEERMQDYRGSRVAMIFQEPMTALNPVLTIGYQMDEQIVRHMGLTRRQSRERALEMLELVGIPAPRERYASYPHQLSGGMRQRAMIAMALSCEPDFLIADEPTTALDVTIQGQILELIQKLQERLHMAVQFITHDLGVISEIADDVLVMYAGTACEKAPTHRLMDAPRHPYTVALLQSIPRIGRREPRLPAIGGTVPTLHELPAGCPFQNRCPRVVDRCRAERPAMTAIAEGHELACFNPVEDR
ncbi:MAG: ABC transporter ATP-binding protein [Steroidobacteraceae bacterium]|jgi:peptide/nickel transport system ATP-binding protein|nr:ABC transporter ATP-binding protein [Steroidobacteraceae bacterium]